MFKAAIFDLDGVLIDSEPLWRKAITTVFNGYGVPLSVSDCVETMGLRVDEVVHYWKERYPNTSLPTEKITDDIIHEVIRLIKTEGAPMAGVQNAIAVCRALDCKLGIASSSSLEIISAVVERFELRQYFTVLQSAQHEKKGKPDPAVYLAAMKNLNVIPQEAVAFEDSINGLRSAKAAGCACICIPDPSLELSRFASADKIIHSLSEISETLLKEVFAN
jgi:HAD superfamily hydrolase (TIGR01509 family)